VIAAFRPVNKNVNAGAFIRAKRGNVHKLLANYPTGGYKFRPINGWNGRIGCIRISAFRLWTHSL